jgi:hypothetical protein
MDNTLWLAVIGALGTGFGILIPKLIDMLQIRPKQKLEEDQFLFTKYREMLDANIKKTDLMEQEIKGLRTEHETCRKENLDLALKVGMLTAENARLSLEIETLKKATTK